MRSSTLRLLVFALMFAAAPLCALAQTQATNPVLWEDLADIDILRVGDVYYYSASNMHYSPGAPVLRSYDLVHWEYVGHSIPALDWDPKYNLQNGARGYVRGSWASFLGYRKSTREFLWGGCIDFAKTHIYAAPAAEGPWRPKAVIDHCYYDAGLLVDDDDTLYVAYGNTTLHVAQLSKDGTEQVREQVVFQTPKDIGVLEGSRFYKRNGSYYIFTTRPANAEYVLRSTHGPFGPYEIRELLKDTKPPVEGAGVPHQGGIVQTPAGDWYYMAFIDAFPGGRVPVLAPLHWDADGWPSLALENNTWPTTVSVPGLAPHPLKPLTGTDRFEDKKLGPEWEWNHNPDNAQWTAGHGGLVLRAATLSPGDDLYAARNTLTHRILGPSSTATIELDAKKLNEGDRAGLVMLRDRSAWIGVVRNASGYTLVQRAGIDMDQKWNTASVGQDVASVPLTHSRVWLRVAADIRPGADRTAVFSYSTDGKNFESFGQPYMLNNRWQFFMGYRYGIFCYATKQLGGAVRVRSFTMSAP